MNPRITAEEFQPLGPPIRTPTPAPEPVRRPDGIVIHPDGRMSTDLPLPDGMGTPVRPFPTAPTPAPTPVPVEDAQCLKPAPLKVGDKVRLLRPGEWRIDHAKPAPLLKFEPLKLGDSVRSMAMRSWVMRVTEFMLLCDTPFFRCSSDDGVINNAYAIANEGCTWERA